MTKKLAKYFLVAFILISFIIPCCLTADAADTSTITIDVKYGQTEARSMLDMINNFRTGSDAWYWNEKNTEKIYETNLSKLEYDYKLEEIAMQRAAEISISFSHTRPDGSGIATLYSGTGNTAYGENIAYGYNSASSVFKAWQETNEKYSGQGHRRNMLFQGFTQVGIGHAVIDGVHYWVQEFGNRNSGMAKTSPLDGYKSVKITAYTYLLPSTTTTKQTTTTKPSTTKQTTTKPSPTTTKPTTTKPSPTTTKPSTTTTITTTTKANSTTKSNATVNNSTTNTTVKDNATVKSETTKIENVSVSQAEQPKDTAPDQNAEQSDSTVPPLTADAVWDNTTEENSANGIQTEELAEADTQSPGNRALYAGLAAGVAIAAGICVFVFIRSRKK